MLQLPRFNRFLWANAALALLYWEASSVPAVSQPKSRPSPSPQAQTNQPSSSFPFKSTFTPPGDGRPKKTKGAGARDGLRCSQEGPVIRAMMPPSGYGLTLQAQPQIVMDFGGETVPSVLLAFKDEQGLTLGRNIITVDSTQPVQSLALPPLSSPLTVGKNYQWSLLVSCDGMINPSHPIFSGWVQRVANTPDVTDTLQQQPTLKQIDWFARHGYWYDAIAALNQGLEQNAEDPQLQKIWSDMLDFINQQPSGE